MTKGDFCDYECRKSVIASISVYLLYGFIAFYPIVHLICNIIGYKFEITQPTAYGVGGVIIAVATVIISLIFKDFLKTGLIRRLCVLSPVFALISTVAYVFNYCTLTAMACMLTFFLCCCVLALIHTKGKRNVIIAVITHTLALIFSVFLTGMMVFFGGMSELSVIKTIDSPYDAHYAQVISIDSGALGGNTVVDVNEYKKEFPFILFSISKKPQRVYIGQWGEAATIEVYFKSDRCLVIDEKEYEIK